MTENKRFTLAYEKGNWWAVRDGDITLWKEEVIYLLNQQDQRITELEEENYDLKFELSKHISDGEWDIRDTTCMAGNFRLEEWGERYHQFYNGDTELEDETVVIMLLENERLKEENQKLRELLFDPHRITNGGVTDD